MIVLASDGGNEGGGEKDTEGGDDDDDGPQTAGPSPGRHMPTELENFRTPQEVDDYLKNRYPNDPARTKTLKTTVGKDAQPPSKSAWKRSG